MFGLTVWSARWTTSKGASPREPQERSGHRIGTTLLDEFLNSALLCATMASIANGLAGRRTVRLMGPLQVFLPPEPNLFNVVRNNLVPTDTAPHVVQSLNDFYDASHVATHRTRDACRGLKTVQLATAIDWSALCQEWRWASGCACLVDTRGLVESNGDPLIAEREQFVRGIVQDARDGHSPCVAGDGVVIVPGLVDRRRDTRRPLGQRISLETNAGTQSVVLQDIAVGGMGLALCRGLQKGMPVTAVLSNGRRLFGITVWSDLDRAGVRFTTPLLATDPLLTAPVSKEMNARGGHKGLARINATGLRKP